MVRAAAPAPSNPLSARGANPIASNKSAPGGRERKRERYSVFLTFRTRGWTAGAGGSIRRGRVGGARVSAAISRLCARPGLELYSSAAAPRCRRRRAMSDYQSRPARGCSPVMGSDERSANEFSGMPNSRSSFGNVDCGIYFLYSAWFSWNADVLVISVISILNN